MDNKLLKPKASNVIMIEPIKEDKTDKPRYAAYVRVSSSSEEQLHSFSQQISHYIRMFNEKEDEWELVDIYADQGITGTSLEKRDEFNRMLTDCRLGKIDKIITKSMTRFARDSVTTMSTIRELKSLGITVMFEDDSMDTSNMQSEILFNLQSIMAQNGSKTISENTRKGFQMRAMRGEYTHSSKPYGYDIINKQLVINESQSKIVRRIFTDYLCGISITKIAQSLTLSNIPTPQGKKCWQPSTVDGILINERVIGDMKLQKKFSTDTLPIQKVINRGQKDMYYVENTHDAIIDRDTFLAVQELIKIRKTQYKNSEKRGNNHYFSKVIRCEKCGRVLRRKVVNNKAYWSCDGTDRGLSKCDTTFIPEIEIEKAFVRMYEKLRVSKDDILTPMLNMLIELRIAKNNSNEKLSEISASIRELHERSNVLNGLRAKGVIDSAFCIREQTEINNKMSKLKKIKEQIIASTESDNTLLMTKSLIEEIEIELAEFDEMKFKGVVESAIAMDATTIKFKLINGLKLCETIERNTRCCKKIESYPMDIK